ncbi:MAG: hypothetical protein BIFFINMI_02250 [Phycisphaerae bacterium]|nr:hypothetical protein [Phycisphaerae bacterium]
MNRSRSSSSLRLMLAVLAATAVGGYWLLRPTLADNGADAAGGHVVGVVDVAQIIAQARELQDAKVQLTDEQGKLEAEVNTRRTRLQQMEDALKKLKPEQPDFNDKQDELVRELTRFRVEIEERKKALVLKHLLYTAGFYKKLNDAIADIAKAKGLDVVLYKESYTEVNADSIEEMYAKIQQRKVLYNSARCDLTPEVLNRLNRYYHPVLAPREP